MTKVRIVHNNLWRKGVILTQDSQHPQFPAIDTQVSSIHQPWRTRYGAGTGNGVFVVADANKYIDFDEGGAELTGTLTVGTYNGNTLATEIAAALNAAPDKALTYTCVYDEATAKFTIAAGGNFTIRWNTGTHKATDISALAGFSDAADDTGAATYTSDTRVVHYPCAFISCDTVNIVSAQFFAIIGHGISSAATIKFIGADDAAYTTNAVEIAITYNATSIFYFHSSVVSKRYWKLEIQDPTNSQAYVMVGTVVLGPYWEPTRSFGKHSEGKEDRSEVDYSDSGDVFCQRKKVSDVWALPFSGLTDSDRDLALALLEDVGLSNGIIICTDYNYPNSYSYWVLPLDLNEIEKKHDNYWTWTLTVREIT